MPHHHFVPFLPVGIKYIRGQLELGEGGFLHWQIVSATARKCRRRGIIAIFGDQGHYEPTRSSACLEYVWKEDTQIFGTKFELGEKPWNRSSKTDWDAVRVSAIAGDFDNVPSDVFVRCYHQLRTIRQDNLQPFAMERTCAVFWGTTGTGKSRRAWEEAGVGAYIKNPNTKFWDGYRGQDHVIIDEFRGRLDISYLLQWTDRYPCIVEVKGSSAVLRATRFWILSNKSPRDWYPEEDPDTVDALMRRLNITHFQ